jgi:DNA-binding transcriptional LysR family regulator
MVFGRLHVVPVVVAFLEVYPEVDVRLVLGDRVTSLVDENIDVALRISVLPDSTLVATRLGDIRRVVCASRAYFYSRGMPRHPSELSQHTCISFQGQSDPGSWKFGTRKSPIIVPIRSRLTVTTAEASIDAAKLGAGITRVLSYQVEDAIKRGELVLALEEFEPPPIPLSIVYRGGGLLPLKLRAFIDFVAPRLRERLAHGGRLSPPTRARAKKAGRRPARSLEKPAE